MKDEHSRESERQAGGFLAPIPCFRGSLLSLERVRFLSLGLVDLPFHKHCLDTYCVTGSDWAVHSHPLEPKEFQPCPTGTVIET